MSVLFNSEVYPPLMRITANKRFCVDWNVVVVVILLKGPPQPTFSSVAGKFWLKSPGI